MTPPPCPLQPPACKALGVSCELNSECCTPNVCSNAKCSTPPSPPVRPGGAARWGADRPALGLALNDHLHSSHQPRATAAALAPALASAQGGPAAWGACCLLLDALPGACLCCMA